MEKDLINELKDLVNKAYEKANDSKISMYLHIMDLLDLYDINITLEKKNEIKKELGVIRK